LGVKGSTLEEFVHAIEATLRRYYPLSHVDRIELRKGRLIFYGKADDFWFKAIIHKYGSRYSSVRVYSPSKTVERVLKKGLERHVERVRSVQEEN